jgi:hypothetical protein
VALIVEAVKEHAANKRRPRGFLKEAIAADAEMERTGEVYRADVSGPDHG